MKNFWSIVVLATAAVASAPSSAVVAVSIGPATADSAARPAAAAPADAAAPANVDTTTRSGVIAAVAANGAQVQLNGSWWKVAPGATRIFRQGREVGAESLSVGKAVRYTTASNSAGAATLGIVYLP